MRKNIPGQFVAGQLISKLDGSVIATGVSVVCSQDNGAQAAGIGTLVYKGNGVWIYLPTQAETNGNHVVFTFIHPSAVVTSVQIYTIGYDPQNPGFSGGTGAFLVTVTVTDGVNPLQGVIVQVTDLVTPATLTTNASGQATFSLNAATYWVSLAKAGYAASPVQRTVTGNQAGTLVNPLTMTQVVIPAAPADLSMCRVYGYFEDLNGIPIDGETIEFSIEAPIVAKSEKTIGGREAPIKATILAGVLKDSAGNPYIDLQRTDLMTPAGMMYRVIYAGGKVNKEISLAVSTADLKALI